jgi:hypothetical protein
MIDGHEVRLRTGQAGTGAYQPRRFWQGFFPDPSAQRLADASRSIRVRVFVMMRDGSVDDAKATAYVSEGYG